MAEETMGYKQEKHYDC